MEEDIKELLKSWVIGVDDGFGGLYQVILADPENIDDMVKDILKIIQESSNPYNL